VTPATRKPSRMALEWPSLGPRPLAVGHRLHRHNDLVQRLRHGEVAEDRVRRQEAAEVGVVEPAVQVVQAGVVPLACPRPPTSALRMLGTDLAGGFRDLRESAGCGLERGFPR